MHISLHRNVNANLAYVSGADIMSGMNAMFLEIDDETGVSRRSSLYLVSILENSFYSKTYV